jgi:hypothetical protein
LVRCHEAHWELREDIVGDRERRRGGRAVVVVACVVVVGSNSVI